MLNKEDEKILKSLLVDLEAKLDTIQDSDVQKRLQKTFAKIASLDKNSFTRVGEVDAQKFAYELNGLTMELSGATSGEEKNITLRLSSYQDHRASEQEELNNHDKNEPGALKFKSKKEWQGKRDQLVSRLYAPGPKSSSQTVEISIKENTKSGDVYCLIDESHRNEEYGENARKSSKNSAPVILTQAGESSFKFLNGKKLSKNDPEFSMM